jgi:nicotinamidase/pyrazinamidase
MKTAFFDIDTQCDFMLPAGALYVPGAERILPAVARLNRYAAARGFPVVSTMDAHPENDPEFDQWPPHCVAGTLGQRKPAETLVEKQIIFFEKQTLSLFENPAIVPLLKELAADAYVVYGVVTEICVRFAALGLLETGKPVTLVTDAVETLKREDSERTLQEFTARGGRLATVAEICP